MKQNMLEGNPTIVLIKFSLPLIVGNILQNLYNFFDTAIVGHIVGKDALVAVGNSYMPMLIANSIIIGISSGISIVVSQLYGLMENQKIIQCLGSIHTLTVLIGFSIAIFYFAKSDWIFELLGIPCTSIRFATSYLRIIAIGIPFQTAYDFYSSVLRATGNSRVPVVVAGTSCIINIFLDFIFAVYFHWGIEGVAIATIIAQAFSAFIIVFYTNIDTKIWLITPNTKFIFKILKSSIASIVQNGASAISASLIQRLINRHGIDAIGGYTAAYKIETILTLPATSIGTALSVFVGQNISAKKIKRVKYGLKSSTKVALLISIIEIAIIYFTSPTLIRLIVGNECQMIHIGSTYLYIISVTFPFYMELYLLTNFLRGAGEVAYPIFNTLLEVSIRTISAFVLSNFIGLYGIFLCRPVGFIVSTINLTYRYMSNKWYAST